MVTSTGDRTTVGPVTIRPGDPRYLELTTAANGRFRCRPRQVRVVGSTAQVVEAVQDAVRGGMRVVARSGGHCLEDFVDLLRPGCAVSGGAGGPGRRPWPPRTPIASAGRPG
ncbi:hypothetical protein GA0070623_3872 [Micromonospora rifamycinica]|uniref:FAD binding domain-containing protein n=1 Tax=Micromonospora rifamycinica TaxID=291594 RepID=A0A1C5JUM2_9ACTN|nr:hypothetical protein GA0070623_3872 [Micromonospora rifamycinica]